MMKFSIFCTVLPVALVAIGAASVMAQTKPVDCSSAEADIAHLQHEKKSTDERKLKGVMSIMPIGIAINAVSSAADSSKEMPVDDYNKKLDERISEIKDACKM